MATLLTIAAIICLGTVTFISLVNFKDWCVERAESRPNSTCAKLLKQLGLKGD